MSGFLREIVTKLGFTIDEKKIKEFEDSITQIKKNIKSIEPVANNIKKAIYGITGAATGLTLLSRHTAKSIKNTELLAEKLNVTTQEMQSIELAAQASGVSVDELIKSMSSIDKNKSIKEQIKDLEQFAYIIDEKGVQSSKNFLKAWSDFQVIIMSVKRELSVKFMPVFNELMKGFKSWYIENKKLISQNISSFINILGYSLKLLFGAVQVILKPISGLIELLGGMENTVRVLGVAIGVALIPKLILATSAFARLTIAMLTNPAIATAAAITAISIAVGLLVDDLWNWASGNESVTARILYDWFGFEGTFKDIVDKITGYFTEKFKAMGEWFSEFFGNILTKITKVTDKATNFTKEWFDDTKDRVNNNRAKHKAYLNSVSGTQSYPELVDITNQSGINTNEDFLDKMGSLNYNMSNSPLISPTASSVAPSSVFNNDRKVNMNITENITVNVPMGTTSEQSKSISEQIADELQMQFSANMLRGIDSLSGR